MRLGRSPISAGNGPVMPLAGSSSPYTLPLESTSTPYQPSECFVHMSEPKKFPPHAFLMANRVCIWLGTGEKSLYPRNLGLGRKIRHLPKAVLINAGRFGPGLKIV